MIFSVGHLQFSVGILFYLHFAVSVSKLPLAASPAFLANNAAVCIFVDLLCLCMSADVEMQMKKPGTAVYAAFDYSAENADELTFSVGDELTVLQCGDDVETDWWWCQLGELKGYVPQNLVAVSTSEPSC